MLLERAQQAVLKQCEQRFRQLLMTSPSGGVRISENRGKERAGVLGLVLEKYDRNNGVVTAAVVDHEGELKAIKEMTSLLLFQRRPKAEGGDERKRGQVMTAEQQQSLKKDMEDLKELITSFRVGLVVVGANGLSSVLIYDCLRKLAGEIEHMADRNSEAPRVIFGSLEVPKLQAMSQFSKRCHRDLAPNVAQALSLARFEQDPLNEVLNLWSQYSDNNLLLSLNLHKLQKQVNRAKLTALLETVAVRCVNEVGVDLNLAQSNQHMQMNFNFLSGLGPRLARRLLQRLQSAPSKPSCRSTLLTEGYLPKCIYYSANTFMKIIPVSQKVGAAAMAEYLDQTRICVSFYLPTQKLAWDVVQHEEGMRKPFPGGEEANNAVKKVFEQPRLLQHLDREQYAQKLKEKMDQANNDVDCHVLLTQLVTELEAPFKDPRISRAESAIESDMALLLLLIDETPDSFCRGTIVTATVKSVLTGGTKPKVLCRLENDLIGDIEKSNLSGDPSHRIEDLLQIGQSLAARITEIIAKTDENGSKEFSLKLDCRQTSLESHADFIPQWMHERNLKPKDEDLKNQAFQLKDANDRSGPATARRIRHNKFGNSNCAQALKHLQRKPVGDFLFRPSRHDNKLTLTWKFFDNCF